MPENEVLLGWLQLLVAACLGGLFTLLGVLLSNRHARELASRSGAFRRPKTGLSLFGLDLRGGEDVLAWCLRHPGPVSARALYRLPFAVTNGGDLRCDDLVLTLQGPAECFGREEGLEFTHIPAVVDDLIKRAQMPIGHLCQLSYKVSRVGAGSAVGIEELFVMAPSVGREHTSVSKTNDDVALTTSVEYSFAYRLHLSLFSPDESNLHSSVSVYCIEGSSVAEMIAKFHDLVEAKTREYLAGASAWERFRFITLRRGEKRRVMFVDCGDGKAVPVGDSTVVWLLDSQPIVGELSCLLPREMLWR